MRKIIKKIAAVVLLFFSLVAFGCSFDASMRGDDDESQRYVDSEPIIHR